jgi:prepilin-type N-terminal cleavage/methylation domain-containing protein
MRNHKCKAFTILEVVVTMLIAAILVGITYSAYRIVSKSYFAYLEKNRSLYNLTSLDRLIKRDFRRSVKINTISDGLQFSCLTDTVFYGFKPSYVTRTQGITDTFRINISELRIKFLQTDITPSAELLPVDELSFLLQEKQDTIAYHYFKLYSSEELVKISTHAIH